MHDRTSSCPRVLSHFANMPFYCMPSFFPGKGWQLKEKQKSFVIPIEDYFCNLQ